MYRSVLLKQPHQDLSLYTLWQSNLTEYGNFCVWQNQIFKTQAATFFINPYSTLNLNSYLSLSLPLEKTLQFTVVSRKKKGNIRIKTCRFKSDEFLPFAWTSNTNYSQLLRHHPVWRNITSNYLKHGTHKNQTSRQNEMEESRSTKQPLKNMKKGNSLKVQRKSLKNANTRHAAQK